jgi:hypothetical protein
MTTYKEIFGKYVKNYSSDPSSDAEGQVWYNTTSGTFKSVLASAAWSSGSPLNQVRTTLAGMGTQTAGLAAGGNNFTTVSNNVSATEEYNGSGWAVGGNMGTARRNIAGAGTQTAGLGFGGYISTPPGFSNLTEEYDGSAWAGGGNLGTARIQLGGAGTQTSGLGFLELHLQLQQLQKNIMEVLGLQVEI